MSELGWNFGLARWEGAEFFKLFLRYLHRFMTLFHGRGVLGLFLGDGDVYQSEFSVVLFLYSAEPNHEMGLDFRKSDLLLDLLKQDIELIKDSFSSQ